MISETHFTSRTVFRLPRYTVFHTTHPDDTAHGGAAVVIRNSLRHYEHRLQNNELQAIAVHLVALPWPLTVSAVYCPPRQAPSSATYAAFSSPWDQVSWSEAIGTRSIPLGARVLPRPKDALSSLHFADAIALTTAMANRPTGRRTITGYLTCWTSLSPGVWQLIIYGSSLYSSYHQTTHRLLPPLEPMPYFV